MNHFFGFILGTLIMLLNPGTAMAQKAGVASEFKVAARSIPQALLKAGYQRLGKLHLEKVLKNIESLKVQETPWVETAVGDQRRIFARWERTQQGPQVLVNTTTWGEAFPQHHGTLALHEVLGAHGFDDEDYNLSTALWFLSQDSQKKTLTRAERLYVEEQIKERTNKASSGGGGVIGVGGGGDMFGPALKITMLESAYQDYQKDRSEENREKIFRQFRITQMFGVEGSWQWR